MEFKPRLCISDGPEFEMYFLCYHLHDRWSPSGISPFLIAAEQLVGAPFYFTSQHVAAIRNSPSVSVHLGIHGTLFQVNGVFVRSTVWRYPLHQCTWTIA